LQFKTETLGLKYIEIASKFRPSHADYTYEAKIRNSKLAGGGRASARETIGRVAAGAGAKGYVYVVCRLRNRRYVKQIHDVVQKIDRSTVKMKDVEKKYRPLPNAAAAKTNDNRDRASS